MLNIKCPYCGEREEHEFSCGGEAHIARPLAENKITDHEFGEYLFLRDNPKGVFLERWRHAAGCRRWFNMVRDTVTHEIIEIWIIKGRYCDEILYIQQAIRWCYAPQRRRTHQ